MTNSTENLFLIGQNSNIDRDLLYQLIPQAKIISLDSNKDFLQQIETILPNYRNISHLHILLPQEVANSTLNNLDTTNFDQSSQRLNLWEKSFSDNAILHFYRFDNQANSVIPVTEFFLSNKDTSSTEDSEIVKQNGLRRWLTIFNHIDIALDSPQNNQTLIELNLSQAVDDLSKIHAILSNQVLGDATVTTDLDDYPPGSTAIITGENFNPGETIELQVLHTDEIPNTGGGHEPWLVTDGGEGDLDGKVDGNFETTWYVNPDDSANSAFKLTAIGLSSGETATHHFTDSDPAVQFFYIPKTEEDILTGIKAIATNATNNFNSATNINTVISITVSTDDSIIYYDHWEDGYESDISNPTQSTTEIWGDNNPDNGIPDGYTTDVLDAGNIISLENSVNPSTTASVVDFDGEDKIGASKAIVVSRPYYPDAANGELIAESVNVYDTSKWGTSYKIPLGENLTSTTYLNPASVNFGYTGLFVTAAEDNTTLTITGADTTGDNVADSPIVTTINEGESYFLNGGVLVGTEVTGSTPIQAHLLTGIIGSTYGTRAYTLVPTDQWSNSYYTPVGTVVSTKPTDVFLYNPDTSNSITVNYETQGSSGTVSVPAGTVVRYTLPLDTDSGAHFDTNDSNDVFFATTAFDSENSAHDWGFSLIPEANLTPIIQVGWGPGNGARDENGNPLWVMATHATTIYVDYDGDGEAPNTDINGTQYDESFSIGALETIQITDTKNNDFDQSGIKVYTVDGTPLASAWGQDANAATAGTSLDLGTEILPLPIAYSWKEFNLVNDVDSDGKVDPGDTIEFTINIVNEGVVVLGNVNVSDIIPDGTTYIGSTTEVDGVAIGDDGSGTAFPFDDDNIANNIDDGLNIGNIPVGGSASVSYQMLVNNPYDGNLGGITNSAAVDSDRDTLTVAVNVPVDLPTETKSLYLSGTNDLDRIDPVSSGDTTTSTSISLVPSSFNFRDKFTTASYSNNDGSLNWNGNWIESGDDGSATSGDAFFSTATASNQSGSLRLKDGAVTGTPSLAREADLSNFSSARLSFNFGTLNTETGDTVVVEVSYNGGSGYSTLETFSSSTAFTGLNHRNYLLTSGSLSSNTRVRFRVTGGYIGTNEFFVVDDLIIDGYSNTKTVRDEFGTAAYTNNNGTNNWDTNWIESGDDSSASAGKINITSGQLQLTDNPTPATTPSIYREVDLSNATNAVLSFNFATTTGVDSNDKAILEVSDDGGTTYQTLETFTGFTGVTAGLRKYNLEDSIDLTADTRIRFRVTENYETSGEIFSVDNVEIAYNTSAAFNQSVAMTSDFDLLSGENVVLTSYIDVSSGTPTTSSDLNATLTYDSGTIGTATPTAVTLVSGTVYQVTWTATLDANVTVPAGESINLEIANNQPKLNFTVLSDSSTYPSKIDLPTTTFINIDSIEFYNQSSANGGNQLSAASEGDTVYVRVQVSDPFGDSDITGLNLVIDDPDTPGIVNVDLDDGDLVGTSIDPSGNSIKIYEYAWTIGSGVDLGDYTVTATATEGLETTPVTDTDSTTFTVNDGTVPDVFINDASNTEGNKLVFNVTLTEASDTDIVLNLATTEGTATEVGDYEITNFEYSTNGGTTWISAGGTNGTQVTIPAGSTGIKVRIDSTSDTADEPNETFILGVDSVVSGSVGSYGDTGTGTIIDDDATPTISINDVSAIEGNSNNKQFNFTISLSNPSGQSITVEYDTANGTATAGSDYTAATNQTVTFAPGETEKTITVLVTGEITVESDETFTVDLSNATNATILDSSGTGTILNDDSVALLSINDVSITEGDSGTQTLTFTVNRSGTTTSAVTVDYATADNTATTGNNDYESLTGTVSFASGETSKTISITINGDTPPEADETLYVNLSNATNATISDSQGIGTIINDDASGTISGNVKADTNNNNTGDTILSGVTIELLDTSGNSIDSDSSTSGIQPTTTTTDSNGDYEFTNVTPGSYLIKETDPTGYTSVSDGDTTDGGDDTTNSNTNDNFIPVTITDNETDSGNNFVDEQTGTISGEVLADTNNDDVGDSPLEDVTVELYADGGSTPIATTTTNSNGGYSFTNLAPGNYEVRQTNLTDYTDVSDADGTSSNNINTIDVSLSPGETDNGNDFVDERGVISGKVQADTDNNNVGDTPLVNVTLTLKDNNGDTVDTTTTDANGDYSFTDLPSGTYTVTQTNLGGYADVNEQDSLDDGADDTDLETSASNNDNILDVVLVGGEADTGNDFVDEALPGSISGKVLVDTNGNGIGDSPLAGVTVTLGGDATATTTTASDGSYSFTGLAAGSYTVTQTNLSGYDDVNELDSYDDGTDDTDLETSASNNDNVLTVVLATNEADTGNDFVDEAQLGSISGTVTADTDGDDIGDSNLSDVTLSLLDNSNNPILDTNGDAITTTTNASGAYTFSNLAPGTYKVVETDPTGYSSVKDEDSDDTDDANTNTNNNSLTVTLSAGENDTNNNFVDEQNGSISGTVKADTTGDTTGDTNLSGVTLSLKNSSGNVVATTTTASNGTYSFTDVTPGDYTVVETDPTGYSSINDTDSINDGANDSDTNSNTNDNILAVSLSAGEADTGNDFVDGQYGSISGNVKADTNNDNTGDVNLASVTITLKDSSGTTTIATTTTNSNGNYTFSNVAAGSYTVVETDPSGYVSVKDADEVSNGANDSDTNSSTNDNILAVTLIPGESDTGNNFVDEQTGTISGNVKADTNNDNTGDINLAGVTINLRDSGDTTTIATTTTDGSGNYTFSDVTPGSYLVKETNLGTYNSNVSDEDSVDDGADDSDSNSNTTDDILAVDLVAGESDTGNDFVDESNAASGTISGQVLEDTDGDGIGDSPLTGVTITLSGASSGTTTTASDGTYSFTGLANGNYAVTETNPSSYGDVDESDGTNNNSISVTINNNASTGNDFVDGLEASISGVVWSDFNNNGLEGNFEEGVSGLTITLTGGGADGVIGTGGDDTTDTVNTAGDGSYSFTGLNPGEEYQVTFPTSATGYTGLTTQNQGSDDTIDSDANVSTGNTATITLSPDEAKTDVDAGLVPTNTITIGGTPSSETLTGTSGNDVIAGYKGQDTLTGGSGNDTFFYNETSDGVDVITDFVSGSDEIDISQILANETSYSSGNPFTQGYAIVTDYPLGGAMVQIDFDGTGGSSLVKSVVLIDNLTAAGVDITGSDSSDTDFIF